MVDTFSFIESVKSVSLRPVVNPSSSNINIPNLNMLVRTLAHTSGP